MAFASTYREASQAPFRPPSEIHFFDLNRLTKIDGWRIKRSDELLDALSKRPIRHGGVSVQLWDTRVDPEKHVEREQQLVEVDPRVGEDRAGLVVERTVTIHTEMLKRAVAAVVDHRPTAAVRALEAIAPVDLLEQVCGACL